MALSNETLGFEDYDNPQCAEYETYTLIRFILIVMATLIAVLGTAANGLLVYIFCTKKQTVGTPATLYPTCLAFLDFAICLEYILLFGVDAIVSYVQVECLFILYYIYIIPTYVVSRITQLAIPYMLVFATLERLVWTYGSIRSPFLRSLYSESGRYWTMIICLTACVLLRLSTAFAMEVGQYPLCEDFFRTMTTEPRQWARESHAYYVFDFHLMTIAQTLVPFVLLVFLNMVIVRKMGQEGGKKDELCRPTTPSPSPSKIILGDETSPKTRKISALGLSLQPLKGMSAGVRSAVYTMTAIVTSYLISNTLHLILTVLERSKHPWLVSEEDPMMSSTFHTFFSDMVSFVYMFTSAIRLAIYYGCNPTIRKDIRAVLCTPKETEIYL